MGHALNGEVAYILKGFPRLSETFIANEIHLLESLGLRLRLYSIKPGERAQAHGVVERIAAPLVELPDTTSMSGKSFSAWWSENWSAFAHAHRAVWTAHPLRYARALLSALRMTWNYRSGPIDGLRTVVLKEFLQAGYIANDLLCQPRVGHLHAHFCHGATTVAYFVSRLCNVPFSFTAHAKDIYLEKLNPGDMLHQKMRAARFVVTCTGANRTHLTEVAAGVAPVHCIYHGQDLDLFRPQPRSGVAGKPVILSVGRLVEKKGFDYLVQACAILRDQGRDFECHIYGGRDDHATVIDALIDQLDLRNVVHLKGSVTQEALRQIYQDATLFALPCLVVDNGDRDGIPNVLVEAMAMELPVVSTAISGIPELVADGTDGLLVEEKAASAMASAMSRILDDPAFGRRLGIAARDKVCTGFDSKRTTVALKNLLAGCLEQQASATHVCCAPEF